MTDPIEITPVLKPVRGTIRPPGSKSLTNRALVVAALADGTSQLTGVLDSQDTRVMIDSLTRLGFSVSHDHATCSARISGQRRQIPASAAELWLENSGTSIRFLTALCALGRGRYRLDGNKRMRERPIGDLTAALRQWGVDVSCELDNDSPPLVLNGNGLDGGTIRVGGQISSQFLSALLMVAPSASAPVRIEVQGGLVSEPYVAMTRAVLAAFGVKVESPMPGVYEAAPQIGRGREYAIEPDASAASYFFAAAAITGGEVTVEGLSENSLQGDVRFVECLSQMGCKVKYGSHGISVSGGPLQGIDVNMNAISDTAQTLAAVAVFAKGPTRIRNVAHIRHKETDRVAALATELRRLGQTVEERADGLTIQPGPICPATVETYDDHRMAMSLALVGLRSPGVRIANPECTSKTYPAFFEDLKALCRQSDSQ